MKKRIVYLLLFSSCVAIHTGCKKENKGTPLSAFAISLRNSCTLPFTGNGDSSQIYLPTAFTPDGSGLNDLYNVVGWYASYPGYFSSFLMKVYDTTGKLVFQSTNAATGWDGVDMNSGKQSTKYKFYVKVNYTTAGHITDSGGTYVYLLSDNAAKTCVNRVYADTANYRFAAQIDLVTGFNGTWGSGETYCD